MNKSLGLTLVLAMLLCLFLPGCSGGAGEVLSPAPTAEATPAAPEPTVNTDTIVWGMTTPWSSLLPYNNANFYDSLIISMLYDQLVYVDSQGNILPRAADSWELSEDGKTLTFHLNQNAKFHDGTPVTAADWVWSLRLLSKAGVGFADQSLLGVLEGVDEAGVETSEDSLAVAAPNDSTLTMTFKQAANMNAFLMSSAYFMVVLPSARLKDIPVENLIADDFWKAPIGSGPAKFVGQSADGKELTLARNADYYMGDANWKTMIFRQCDEAEAAAALQKHDVDIVYSPLANDEALALQGGDGVTVDLKDEPSQVYAIAINNAKVPSAWVRWAVNYAVNKDGLCAMLTGDSKASLASPMELYVPDSNPYYPTDIAYDYNPEKAKSIVEAAKKTGYDGKFVLAAPAAGQRAEIAVQIEQNLEAVGFDVELVTVDAADMMEDLKSGAEGAYDGGLMIYGSSPDPMGRNDIITANRDTVLSLTDPTFDAMEALIGSELDEAKRGELISAFYDYLHQQMPVVWLAGKKQYYAYSAKLGDITDDLIGISRRSVPVWNWQIG